MRTFIHNLMSCSVDGHVALLRGEGGSLTISFFEGGILRFEYGFNGIAPDERAVRAARVMTEGEDERLTPLCPEMTVSDQGYAFTTHEGLHMIVDRVYAVPFVYWRDTLQHGGFMGDGDTVIPRYPARLIEDRGRLTLRCNFPLRPGDEFYGLGDKSGPPDRRGRRFQMSNRDALGYDASNSDPLYKSVPFFIKYNQRSGAMCGLFFPQPMIRAVDFGRESPYFYLVESEGGPFRYDLFLGDSYEDLLQGYCRVTGLPALPPLHSFGYFGSSMNYVEPDDAARRMLDFFDQTEKRGIPCEGMYVSSGYLKHDDGKRYALLWNQKKFPEYGKYLHALAARGYHLLMNIKPGFLLSHPWYEELAGKGYFIQDAQGRPVVEYFWGGPASFLDFTNPAAKGWWQGQLHEQYLMHGCTGIWNDNNELELEDSSLAAYPARAVYPLLMSEASQAAFLAHKPEERPWVYSRAGTAGLQRYARTWTGDNVSDFPTLRYNQYMGWGMGISGLPYVGHDLGGFFGPLPEEELLVRSCESGVLQARFVIHSWRPDGVPTEPWTYLGSESIIRSLILEHYRYMPYIYNCAVEAALTGRPMERLLRLAFPQDGQIASDAPDVLFGPWVLKVNALDKGLTHRQVYLPAGQLWYDPRAKRLYQGGQMIDLPVPMDGSPHLLLREGAIVPTNPAADKSATALYPQVDFLLLPGKESESIYFEDDGRSLLALKRFNRYHIRLSEAGVDIRKTETGITAPAGTRRFVLQLPEGLRFVQNGQDSLAFDPDALAAGETLRFDIKGALQAH
ncbi:MAG: glycoside hydrolase [Clostridiales bacterium]|nr:glycoside hydrolase [Clostridiales bacterium]